MLGLFINTVPLRIKSYEGDTFSSLIKKIHADILAIHDHQYISISEINTARNTSLEFSHIVAYENYPIEDLLSENFNVKNIE